MVGARPDGGGQHIDAIWNHTISQDGDTCTVTISGELDMGGFDGLCRVLLDAATRPGTAVVRADVAGVDFIDSSGIRAFLTAYNQATASGRRFTVTRPPRNVRRVLQITGLLPILCGGDPGTRASVGQPGKSA
jgi:stage II sporulation protein AA (anti-sigma F factor antagonist)